VSTHAPTAPVTRVSTLELFFDLVFVFAITQVSHLFGHAHGAVDFTRAFFVLAVVWWMYGGYAWLTSNVGTVHLVNRVLLLTAMAAFLMIAIRIPAVAGRHGIAFGMAYLVVVLVHGALFLRAPNSSAHAILTILPFNVALAVLVIVSGLVPDSWNWIPWASAGVGIVVTSLVRSVGEFHLSPSHFVERHGLVVLIALGESVVSIGAGAAEVPVGWILVCGIVLGLALAAALWWTYFDRDDVRAEHAMTKASGATRARLALHAFYYAHLVMIVGIVLAAAGLHAGVAELHEPAEHASPWLLAAGVAAYLLGSVWFRRLLAIGASLPRTITAAIALGSAFLRGAAGSLAQLTLVVVALIALLVVERREVA
jgi:low temperature requirement protein LtrA